MQIHVALCDLTTLPVDAVVNPTNSLGIMSSVPHGVSISLVRTGGAEIEQEVRASAPIAVGAALITPGGSLQARQVIHVPTVEKPGLVPSIENVRRATRAALVAAARGNLDVIAMPPMASTGVMPDDEVARAMVDELRAHKPVVPGTVYLVALREEMIACYEEALHNASIPG